MRGNRRNNPFWLRLGRAVTWPLFVALLWVVLAVMIAFVFPTGLSGLGL